MPIISFLVLRQRKDAHWESLKKAFQRRRRASETDKRKHAQSLIK